MQELRPHFARATGWIESVTPSLDGGYVVLTRAGLELFDAALAPSRVLRGNFGSPTLLADGRMVSTASLDVIAPDGTISRLDEVGAWARWLIPSVSGDGFFAVGTSRVVLDRRGTREAIDISEAYLTGGVDAWREGLALAGRQGLMLLDGRGVEVARSPELYLTGEPFVLGSSIVAAGLDRLHVFDAQARPVGELDPRGRMDHIRRFRGGLLVEIDRATLVHLGLADGELAFRWRRTTGELRAVIVAGDRVVLDADTGVSIVAGDGAELERIPDLRWLRDAHPFGGGLVLVAERVLWWRPGGDLAELPHDTPPTVVCPVPAGIASADTDVLCVWRSDLQGPEAEPLTHDLPLAAPLVVEGRLLVIEGAGRFSLRAHAPGGTAPVAVAPDSRWRRIATREEATRVVERLIARELEGPSPPLPASERLDVFTRELAQLPVSETAALHGRAMFASTLADDQLVRLSHARAPFFEELAAALETSPRALLTAVRAGTWRPEPPWPVASHEYLGSFTTSGALTVADPAYVGDRTAAHAFSLSLRLTGLAGTWHVFVRPHAGDPRRNAEMVVMHGDAADVRATRHAGSIGVDSGCVGVFDKGCPRRNPDLALEEGVLAGLGAIVWTAWGDGVYPVLVGPSAGRGKVAKIRVAFDDDRPELDRAVAAAPDASDARPYSMSARFEVGEVIAHPKLGTGTVVRVASDGKIEVQFADRARTLVHGRS